jgi:asparagine synthase (glutamine-hydrolysing)
VRCRVPAGEPVAVHVSGGVDSSSVACIAESLRRAQGGPPLVALSLAFPGEACDESAWADAVAQRWNLSLVRHTPDVSSAPYEDLARRDADIPPYPNNVMSDGLREAARRSGCGVVLTGAGGDDWLSGCAPLLRLFDRLSERRFGGFLGGARLRDLLPLVRHALRSATMTVPVLRFLLHGRGAVPPWIRPELRRRTDLDARLAVRPEGAKRWPTACGRALYEQGTAAWAVHAREMEERASAWFGLEERHPFHDRRLAELCVALPEDDEPPPWETKPVLRRAMRGVLPDSVRRRHGKATFEGVFLRALESRGGALAFRRLAVAEVGWVDEARAREAYMEMQERWRRGDPRLAALLWPLWMVLAVEYWLRAAR